MLMSQKLAFVTAVTISLFSISAKSITVEEQRIEKAVKVMPAVTFALSERVNLFAELVQKANNLTVLSQLSIRHGKGIWNDAKEYYKNTNSFDDRPLYWARLIMSKAIQQTQAFQESLPDQQKKLLWQFQLYSRGQTDIKFDKNTSKKIIITGFDPFYLDRNIKNSNPSGISAIALDDLVISSEGKSAEIETLILPVRYADFDQGMVEELLTPYYGDNAVDMIITLSMGRSSFELDHFSGLRRSSDVPDNLNIVSVASKQNPLIPMLGEKKLKGPEFLNFTLPYNKISTAGGFFPIINNRIVETINGNKEVISLVELLNETSVEGSGGGFLANEVSYRSLLLRDLYNPVLPVGHIHTPSVKGYDEEKSILIFNQLKAMLTQAVTTL